MKAFQRLIFVTAVCVTASAMAAENGTVEIYGKGEASSKPELAKLTVSVVSICYEHAREAKDANAVLADQIVKVLQNFQRGPNDKVVATGGGTVRQSEYTYEEGTSNRKVVCENKWRATNTLSLKMSDLSAIPDVQDAVLAAIDQQAVRPGVVAQTYAQLSEPTFTLLPTTMKKLRADAQRQAWVDAKAQFDNFASVCAFLNPVLASVTPPQEFTPVPRFAAPQSEAGAGGISTPILPDTLTVSATWKFVWKFDPSTACAERL